jgi:phosphatidylinositol alpha-1,6-mannosyltransferase
VIRVALLSSSARATSGWGRFTVDLSRALLERDDVDIRLFLPRDAAPPDDSKLARVTERSLPPPRPSFRRAPWTLRDYLARPPSPAGIDVVHAVVEYPYALVAHAVARRGGIPSIVSAQGTYGVVPLQRLPDRWVYRAALRSAATVTVPSVYTRDAMVRAMGRPVRVELLPNAVNLDRFSATAPDDVRIRFGIPAAGPLVLSVGHLKRRKGFDVLVQALGIVRAEGADAHLVVVGPGNVSLLRQQAAALGLGDCVHVVGEVTESDLASLYHACDLFALLPRVDNGHFEGFGLVFLEANACGKPVIGTRSGGVPDAIVDGETGYLVDEGDAEGAAAAMGRVFADKALAARLGAGARRWANEHSWPAYADRLVSLYRAAVAGGEPRTGAP